MKKLIKNPLFMFILGLVIAGSIGVYATIAASSVTYNNTTVDLALDDLYTKATKVFTGSDITSRTSQGNGQATRTTTVELDKGRYIVFTTESLGWQSPSTNSADNAANGNNITCTNECSITRIYGWYNEPHSSNVNNTKYETIALTSRAYYVTITTDNTVITSTTGTSNTNPSILAQAMQLVALKLD